MLLRTLTAVALLTLCSLAKAQAPSYYFFRTEAPLQTSQVKFVIEAVMGVDPSAEVFYSDDMTVLQIKHNGSLSEQATRTAIVGAGVALQAGNPTPEELGLNAVDPNAPPVYVSTGDEQADLARYHTAVEQWNASHPGQQFSTTPVHLR